MPSPRKDLKISHGEALREREDAEALHRDWEKFYAAADALCQRGFPPELLGAHLRREIPRPQSDRDTFIENQLAWLKAYHPQIKQRRDFILKCLKQEPWFKDRLPSDGTLRHIINERMAIFDKQYADEEHPWVAFLKQNEQEQRQQREREAAECKAREAEANKPAPVHPMSATVKPKSSHY